MVKITTQVIDQMIGMPAMGMKVSLYNYHMDEKKLLIKDDILNANGTPDAWLCDDENVNIGKFAIEFEIGNYYMARGIPLPNPPFFDKIKFDFGIINLNELYNIVLNVSPYGYTINKGR